MSIVVDVSYRDNFTTLKDFKMFFENLPNGAVICTHWLEHIRGGLSIEKTSTRAGIIRMNSEAFVFQGNSSLFWGMVNNAPSPNVQKVIDKGNSIFDAVGSGTFYRDGDAQIFR